MNTIPAPIERLSDHTRRTYLNTTSLDFGRFVSCLNDTDSPHGARKLFLARFQRTSHNIEMIEKASVAAATSIDATFAGPLAGLRPLTDAFVGLARPSTVLGKLQHLRRVPFGISVPIETAGGNYAWLGEGAAAGATRFDLATVTLRWAKASGMIVVTKELIKLSAPGRRRPAPQ